jgi:hypothetical protein
MLTKYDLIEGQWYVGRGEDSNVGYWTGKAFIIIGHNSKGDIIKHEYHLEDKNGSFQPFVLLDDSAEEPEKQPKLEPYRWYVGIGELDNVCMWNGKAFLTIAYVHEEPFGSFVVGTDEGFKPYEAVAEGEVVDMLPKKPEQKKEYVKTLRV